MPNLQDAPYLAFFDKTASNYFPEYTIPEGENLDYFGTDRDTFFYKSKDSSGNFKAPYWTNGDFNRDGIDDWVYILFKESERNGYVFTFTSTVNSEYVVQQVTRVGITTGVSTEKFVVNCGIIDVLKVFEFESYGAFYWWNEKTSRFFQRRGEDIERDNNIRCLSD